MPGREASSVSLSGVRMVANTRHPLSAKRSAVARPRPVELPVMKMDFDIGFWDVSAIPQRSRQYVTPAEGRRCWAVRRKSVVMVVLLS